MRASAIINEFGVSLSTDVGKYLGVPLYHKRVTANTFNYVTSKLIQQLSSWKGNSLSLVGLLTLCKSACGALAIYPMQTSLLPTPVCHQISKGVQNFLWRARRTRKKIHLCAQERVCEPSNSRGLAMRNSQHTNLAFMQKLVRTLQLIVRSFRSKFWEVPTNVEMI